MKIEKPTTPGHFEVEYMDGRCGTGHYDTTLNGLIYILARQDREVKSIEWIDGGCYGKNRKH